MSSLLDVLFILIIFFLVTTTFNGSLCGRVGNWDDHAVNHNVFEGLKHRCPFYDQAVAALI